jgi:hypothetical protein
VTLQKAEAEAPSISDSSDRELDFIRSLDIGLRLDTSPLFSFEDFAHLEPARPENEIHAGS